MREHADKRRLLLAASSLLDVEFDALGQRQGSGPVDGYGLAAHVSFPRVAAGFASASGFFFASERSADFGAAGADVHVGDTAIAAEGAQECFGVAQIIGENGGGQALRDVVVPLDGFADSFEFD